MIASPDTILPTRSSVSMEPTRNNFVNMYPPYRYWRPEHVALITERAPLNIYVHIPYCIQRCSYCFYKVSRVGDNRQTEIDRYVDALCREIEIASEYFHLQNRPAISIYFGGGTPSILTGKNLHRIIDAIYANLNPIEPEITLEAEPVTLSPKKAAILKEIGVNRISLGVQSFSDEVIRKTGRVDKEVKIKRAIEIAKDTGAFVNIDLLSGLAGETPRTWTHSIDQALAADVHTITIYKMELYANSQYYSEIKQGEVTLPSDEEEVEFMRYAHKRLKTANYLPTTFFTFGKDGGQHRQLHITSKWEGVDTFAFGISAFSTIENSAYQNWSDTANYIESIEENKLPIQRGYMLNSADRMYRDIVLGLKLVQFNHKTFKRKHGIDLTRVCDSTLADLKKRGFVTVSNEMIVLTDEGVLWGDTVGKRLIASLESFVA